MLKARMLMILRFCWTIIERSTWLSKSLSYTQFFELVRGEAKPQLKKLNWVNISLSKKTKQNLIYGGLLILLGNIVAVIALLY
ncbi:TPA: hypothetical protein QB352_001593 [Pasteurella multocida]|nr:hypothetical protein [Pasteurella multocida]